MTHEKYTDGLLDEKFTSMEDKIDIYNDNQMKLLTEIKEQVLKTNGRVTTHDRLLWTAIGALMMLSVWALWVTNSLIDGQKVVTPAVKLEIQSALSEGIRQALDSYEDANK